MPLSETIQSEFQKELKEFVTDLTAPKEGAKGATLPALALGVTNKDKTFAEDAQGLKNVDTKQLLSLDTQLSAFSCAKSMTALAVLKLYEDKKINLDIPAKTYLPLIGDLKVIEPDSVDESGKFTVPPKAPDNQVTVRHLLLHTSGLAYNFSNADYARLAGTNMQLVNEESWDYFTTEKTPLIFEPGTRWHYGHNYDILGFLVQNVSGKKLGEYLDEILFKPAGMTSSTFHLEDDSNLASVHGAQPDGSYVVYPKFIPDDPALDMGGQGLFTTVGDYLKFLRVWLNYGYSPDAGKQILKEETVRYAMHNHLPPGEYTKQPSFDGSPSEDGQTLTGNAYNAFGTYAGRPVGSIYWGGLVNLYYWVDFENGIAGFYGCQLFPPSSPPAIEGFNAFEVKVYEALKKSKA